MFNQSIIDSSLRNIIDKLAEFVARNGKEFENITKAKQQGNPRFGFLFGGEYNQYYQWRVKAEQTGNVHKLNTNDEVVAMANLFHLIIQFNELLVPVIEFGIVVRVCFVFFSTS